MKKSSVSIPYLVAWILGIIVLAIAVYLIYMYITGSPLDCSQCGAKLSAWCMTCYNINYPKATGWEGANNMDPKLAECVVRCNLLGSGHDSCADIDDETPSDFCKGYIPF